jgi:hypothetical protein
MLSSLTFTPAIDQKTCEKFAMRSREFYYGRTRFFMTTMIIMGVGGGVFIALFIGDIVIYDKLVLQNPVGAALFAIGLYAVAIAIEIMLLVLIVRWHTMRAYNAWKATFEEDWKPKPHYFRKMIGAVSISKISTAVKQSPDV